MENKIVVVREITILDGHKACNKEMKALIDILKSGAKDTQNPFIDLNRNLWITKFNNTFVEMSLSTIPTIMKGISNICLDIKSSGIYTVDLKDILVFRSLIEAPKKDFLWVSIILTDKNEIGIRVSVQSKVSPNKFTSELLFRESRGVHCGLPVQYRKLNYIKDIMSGGVAIIGDEKPKVIPQDSYLGRYVIKGNELDDLNNGLIIVVKDKELNLTIARMMKNVLYRPIKSEECIIDYLIEGETATCVISYSSHTASNPPIKIEQIFMVYPYTDDTDN